MGLKIGSIVCALALILAGCASTTVDTNNQAETVRGEAQQLFSGGFEGNWVGELQAIGLDKAPFETADWALTVRIRIRQGKAEVFSLNENKWSPIYPTQFNTHIQGTNAVLYVTAIAPDIHFKSGFGGWVESRVLLLTRKDDNTLYVSMQRAVNNFLKQDHEDNSRFFTFFVGELARTEL